MKRIGFVALALLLAGCAQPTDSEPVVTPGQAYEFTEGLVTFLNGEPRFRVPGTYGHESGNLWLQKQVRDGPWELSVQEFTGADYEALEPNDANLQHWQSSCGSESDEVSELQFTNIIATFDHPDPAPHILLGAHWESKEDASYDPDPSKRAEPVLGANDGASGVGVLLSLMHDYAPPGDVTIVFFDGEDGFEDCHPLAGSMYYARTMTDAPDAMLLLDMVGDPNASFMLEGNSRESNPELQDLIWSHGEELLPENFVRTQRNVYDDHIPFIQEGVPSVDLIDYGNGFPSYWHTTSDTMDNLHAAFMDTMQTIVQLTLDDWFQMQSS